MKHLPNLLIATLILLLLHETVLAQGYKAGDQARDFSLENTDGKQVSMADFEDAQGFVVVFTCNNCPFAKAYESRINELNNDYAEKGFPVIAINPNSSVVASESLENMKQRKDEAAFTFPYLADQTQEITKTYGATNTPHVYVLEREDNEQLKVRYVGTIDNNYKDASSADKHYVREALDALIEGKEVSETKTKAIGCTIKWRDA